LTVKWILNHVPTPVPPGLLRCCVVRLRLLITEKGCARACVLIVVVVAIIIIIIIIIIISIIIIVVSLLQAYERVRRAYAPGWAAWLCGKHWCCARKGTYYKGRFPLVVEPCAMPVDYIWENFSTPPLQQFIKVRRAPLLCALCWHSSPVAT